MKPVYLSPEGFAAANADCKARMLGAVAFGAQRPHARPDAPYAWVDMAVLGASAIIEVWLSDAPVVRDDAPGIQTARNDDVLFGCVEVERETSFDEDAYRAYALLFDFIDSREYGHLLRVWNYFPEINSDAEGLERYQRFCRGRHDAFVAKGRLVANDAPAACALGTRSGPLIVYFLASRKAGRRVENPRQVSAYRYPAQYGPRSPTFSRAMLTSTRRDALLFISGTAGIVGHETQHLGNAPEQALETIANMRAVIDEARRAGLRYSAGGAFSAKAYLRHPEFLPLVRDSLAQAFGAGIDVVFLQADICRADLLLEIEAVYVEPALERSLPAVVVAATG